MAMQKKPKERKRIIINCSSKEDHKKYIKARINKYRLSGERDKTNIKPHNK